MKNSSPASTWTSAHWLCLLIVAALAGAGWVQAAKWKRLTTELQAQAQSSGKRAAASAVITSSGLALPTSSGPEADSPTVTLIEEVDLMRQVDLLNSENERLNEELERLRENSADDGRAQRDRAAIDGSGGGGILR